MAPGLLAYDLLLFALATAAYGVALRVAALVMMRATTLVPWPFAVVPAAVAAIAVLILEVGVLTALCPALVPGRYPLMKGKIFWSWMVRSMLRRLLSAPGVKWVIFTSNVLRFCALRAMGARVSFTTNMSSDVDVLDPALLEVGPGAIIGARCFISGHYIDRGLLVLSTVKVGERALLAASVSVAPGASIGNQAIVKPLAALGPECFVGDGAQIGGEALLDMGARVEAGADLGQRVHVRPGAVVQANVKVPAGTVVTADTSRPETTSSTAE